MIRSDAPERPPADPRATAARISTAVLFSGRAEIEIEHKGEIYRLRITRAGKLILTK